jgi:hypothetical protein
VCSRHPPHRFWCLIFYPADGSARSIRVSRDRDGLDLRQRFGSRRTGATSSATTTSHGYWRGRLIEAARSWDRLDSRARRRGRHHHPGAGRDGDLAGAALGVVGQRFTNGVAAGQRVTVTDSNGRFLFRDLPASNYQITAAAQGFSSAGYQQAKPNQVRRSLDLPRPVELAPNEKRGDVVINLWRHAGITGTVIDEAGEPIVGLTVSVLTRTLVSGQPVMQNYATAVTDDRGIYWAEWFRVITSSAR